MNLLPLFLRGLPLPNYQPAPQPNKIYNGPAVPAAYDQNWQLFTNLTPAQVAWFQAQPEWAAKVTTINAAIGAL